jgi:sugar lactone lactonase YvrE
MPHALARPQLLLLIFAGLLLGSLLGPGAGAAVHAPARIDLPAGFQPEGITINAALGTRAGFAYLGSLADGDIYRVSLLTGEGRVISQGPGTPSVGLKIDPRGRIFVSGGPAGDARVVDRRGGAVLARYRFANAPTFVNDVVLAGRTVWFTDSVRPRLYGLPLGRNGRLPKGSAVIRLPLRGQWRQVPNTFNANGIERTPDRAALLVVQTATGFLYRVDPHTGIARRVDLGSILLRHGDGMLRDRRMLYVVQNRLGKIAVLRLNQEGTKGRLVVSISSTDFDVPTTVARRGGWLYLPNARFGNTDPEPKPYWVTRVRR